jgi:hypothetical protein
MSDLRAQNDRPVPQLERGAYEPPRAEDLDVAGGVAEVATGAVIPPSSK